MHHSNYVEADDIAVCRQVKEASPSTACLFYWNAEKMYNSSVTAQYMINSKEEWLLQDDIGRFAQPKAGYLCPDYRKQAAGDFYLSACVNATHSGFVDGCTLDSSNNFNEADTPMLTTKYSFTEEEQQQYVAGKRGALQRLQQIAGKVIFVHCATCLTRGKTCAGMSAQMTQKFDVTSEWVDTLRLLASEDKGLLLYNDGANGLDCDDDAERGAMIATFLIGAGANMFFNCGPNCDNANVYPEFRQPLGAPLAEARANDDGLLTRRFAHGAVAKFKPAGANATGRGQACVVWADGSVSGKCPADADAGVDADGNAIGVLAATAESNSTIQRGRLFVDGELFFPLGVFVHNLLDSDWDWLASAGFNTVLSYTNGADHLAFNISTFSSTDRFMDAAASHSIKVFLSLKDYYAAKHPGLADEALVRAYVERYRSHPALLGWYLNDEYKADMLADLEKRNALVRQLDPAHVRYSVEDLSEVSTLKLYANTSNLFGVDPYPWHNSSLTHTIHSEATAISNLHEAFADDGSIGLCTVAQAFDSAVFECRKCSHATPRYCAMCNYTWPPLPVLKAMHVMQPVAGSRGVLSYAYYAQFGYPGPPFTQEEAAAHLADLRDTASSMKELLPLFLQPRAPVVCNDTSVLAAAFMHPSFAGGVTVVAVNAANEPKAVELAVPVPGAAAPVHLALGPWEVRVRRLAFGNGAVYV